MRTLLSRSRVVPLWGFIVIITVGSLMILGLVFLISWCCARRRHGSDLEGLPDAEPTRRVTVRRGRIVPSSHYMSLTGSRFGLGAFMPPDDRENANYSRSGARSKSPFEWWNGITDRSQSRQSEVSHMKGSPLVTGPVQKPSEISISSQQLHGELSSPLRSPTSSESTSKKPPAYSGPVKPSPSLSRPSRSTNFSRAFGQRSALMSPSVSSSLPQIVEISPHTSVICRQSKQTFCSEQIPVSRTSPHSSTASRHSKYSQFSGKNWTFASPHPSIISRYSQQSIWTEKSDSSIAISDLGAMTPRSPLSPIGFQNSESHSNLELSTTMTSSSFDELPELRAPGIRQRSQPRIQRPPRNCTSTTRASSLPRSPRPRDNPSFERHVSNAAPRAACETNPPQRSRQLKSSSATVNRNSSYRMAGDQDNVIGQLSNASLSALPQMRPTEEKSKQAYGESGISLHPVRRKSGKGNVLRKKSLQRAERESWVQ